MQTWDWTLTQIHRRNQRLFFKKWCYFKRPLALVILLEWPQVQGKYFPGRAPKCVGFRWNKTGALKRTIEDPINSIKSTKWPCCDERTDIVFELAGLTLKYSITNWQRVHDWLSSASSETLDNSNGQCFSPQERVQDSSSQQKLQAWQRM